ncbi:hypothetical protein NO135_21940, partial [Clostridioides difficile]|nr:hypothetical protein [Clostridioides difficile]
SLADWGLPGIAEGRQLTGHDTPADIAGFYLAQGARGVVIKLGAEGAYYRTADGHSVGRRFGSNESVLPAACISRASLNASSHDVAEIAGATP